MKKKGKKKKNRFYIIFSGILLVIGITGFAIIPIRYDSNISKERDEISDFEYYRQLSSKSLYDSMDWYRYAGVTANNAAVLSELKASPTLLKKKKEDYINESKFSLNSLVISAHSAKGEFHINEKKLWNKWNGITDPDDFFRLQKKYSDIAMGELKKLEKKINLKKHKINKLETDKKWFWIGCIFLQTIGMFLGIYQSFLSET